MLITEETWLMEPECLDFSEMSGETWACCAAWKKMINGPEQEISTAKNPATVAEIDQSFFKVWNR